MIIMKSAFGPRRQEKLESMSKIDVNGRRVIMHNNPLPKILGRINIKEMSAKMSPCQE